MIITYYNQCKSSAIAYTVTGKCCCEHKIMRQTSVRVNSMIQKLYEVNSNYNTNYPH